MIYIKFYKYIEIIWQALYYIIYHNVLVLSERKGTNFAHYVNIMYQDSVLSGRCTVAY